jgi:hypothetical protein
MSETVYSRSPGVVWRLGPDRVLVRRVDIGGGSDGTAELVGDAALAWIVLDEPGTHNEITDRLLPAQASQIGTGWIEHLLILGWLCSRT